MLLQFIFMSNGKNSVMNGFLAAFLAIPGSVVYDLMIG